MLVSVVPEIISDRYREFPLCHQAGAKFVSLLHLNDILKYLGIV